MRRRRARATAGAAVVGAVLALGFARPTGAQVDPSEHWETLTTEHFHLHFTPPLEAAARRAAVNAERAYAALARELVPPREPIDIVLSDNVDFSNGATTPFPTNHIILYAHPPVDAQTLRFYGDWNSLLIQHELTHVFHLDRARGWWSVAQHVLGRNPLVMPNLYTPAWLTEGLAVYYESRLTGFGRIAGTAHRTVAAAAAADADLPRLDQLSLTAPEWPNGNGVYAYGSLLFQYLSDTRGPETIPRFVEISSGQTIPFLLDRSSREAFGISFEDAWRQWRDSVRLAVASAAAGPTLALTTLTHEGSEALFPRWLDDSSLVYAADNERELPGAYSVTVGGHETRLDRRNDIQPNTPIPAAATSGAGPGVPVADDLIFGELDFTSPYDLRSDLYRTHAGHTVRLTHGARLSYADARADGLIVAVQATPASTRLVTLGPLTDTARARDLKLRALTGTSPDTQWAEPRWAPDGTRIAAVRWLRGGYSEIVVLDTTGHVTTVVTRTQAVESSPAWTSDGEHILFTSDRTGRTEVYVATLGGPGLAARVALLGGAGAGVFYPAPSPDGRELAVAAYRGDGYHIAITPLDIAAATPVNADSIPTPAIAVPPVEQDTSPAHRYNSWRGLIPRYWTPVTGTSDQGYFEIGAYTSATDAVGRNAYELQALYNVRQPAEPDVSFDYAFRGIGNPVLDAGAALSWDHERVADQNGNTIGLLVHSSTTFSLAETMVWPTERTSATWSVGTQVELRDYHTTPAAIINLLGPVYTSHPFYPALFTTVTWANPQYPDRAISPENGVSLTATAQEEWQPGNSGGSVGAPAPSVVGIADAYRALPFGGFAHHVIALRIAAGWEGTNASSTFSGGGTNGAELSLVPGISVGDQSGAFGVRGYGAGSARGTDALAGSVEYRLPLAIPGRGLHLLPVFLGRVSLAAFADAGEAWCPTTGGSLPPACSAQDAQRRLMSSIGSEIDLDTGLQYDVPFRLRLGFAVPTANRAFYGNAAVSPYLGFGYSF